MKNWNSYTVITAMIALFVISSCDNLSPESANQADDLTEQELEMAAQIIGNSLSDKGEGVLASLYDAVSQIDQERISYERPAGSMDHMHRDGVRHREHTTLRDSSDHDGGRGRESNYNASYNPETGEHTIRFHREFVGPDFSKSLKVHSVYIYTNIDGRFLQFPRRQQDHIETIDFKGKREGETRSAMRSNSFFRADTLFLDGISSATPVLTLEGTHYGNGEMSAYLERRDIITNRSYEVFFELQDIQIDKAIVRENGSLEDGITGFINYRLQMSVTKNGDTSVRNLSGVIELTGDGHALLRFEKLQKFFRIALGTGTPDRPTATRE